MEGQKRSLPRWDQLLPDLLIALVKWALKVSYLKRNVPLDKVSYIIGIDLATIGN